MYIYIGATASSNELLCDGRMPSIGCEVERNQSGRFTQSSGKGGVHVNPSLKRLHHSESSICLFLNFSVKSLGKKFPIRNRSRVSAVRTSPFETFLMMCRSTYELSLLARIHFSLIAG